MTTFAPPSDFMSLIFLLPSSELQVLVKRISNYWLGTFAYILIFIAVADILRLVLKKIPGKIHDFFFSKVGYVFVGILLTALIGGISAYGIVHSNIVKVKPYEVTIRKNCGDNRDLKVVLVADLHLGYSVGNGQMQHFIAQTAGCCGLFRYGHRSQTNHA